MIRDDARDKYNSTVEANLSRNIEDYKDPDIMFTETIEVVHPFLKGKGQSELDINLSSDGICGIKTIEALCNKPGISIQDTYKLIRKNRFDCLIWPAYAMSINQMRYSVFRDRLDLTLMDIECFYEVIEKRKFCVEAIGKIQEACKLHRAYLNVYTLAWLCSFESFDDFIKKRGLHIFADFDGEHWHVSNWAGESVDPGSEDYMKYFSELLDRLREAGKEQQ